MDPDTNLKEQLDLARAIQKEWDRDDEPPVFDPSDMARLADLVLALDQWIVNGGFYPQRWAR